MKIGIDISQLAYKNTGVANFLEQLVTHLIQIDKKNEYILFYSSMRNRERYKGFSIKYKGNTKVCFKAFPFPPTFLDFLWNKLHIIPIEWFIGEVDIFISSDWTQPPTQIAKKATILYDLIIYKYPEETAEKIVDVQKRKLEWVKKECDIVFCISNSTKNDAKGMLQIDEKKLHVLYPGI